MPLLWLWVLLGAVVFAAVLLVWFALIAGGRADDRAERGHGWRAGASGRWP